MSSDPEHHELITGSSLQSHIAVALKLAKFRPSRYTLESDEICKEAARAVVVAFERAQWQVFKTGTYRGWGPEGSASLTGRQPYKRCENCDD